MYDWVDKLNHRQNHSLKYALEAWSFLNQGESVHFTNDRPVATMIPSEIENIRKKSRIFFTSGTTGVPKRAFHDEETLSSSVFGLLDRIGDDPYDAFCCLPLHHVGGWMQLERAVRTKGRVLFGSHRDLLREDMGEMMKNRWVSLVPTQLHSLFRSTLALSNLRKAKGVFVGGAQIAPSLATQGRLEEIPLNICYGMTETASMITLLESKDFLDSKEGVGECLSHSKIRIANSRFEIRSDSLCYRLESSEFSKTDWIQTSDEGKYVQDEGYHFITRSDRCINSGGKKINPERVEGVLLQLPEVEQCVVLGEEDEFWGQKAVTYLVLVREIEPQELKRRIKEELLPHEIPKEWRVVKELPALKKGL